MTTDEEPRPMTPLDEVYAELLTTQPNNPVLWERIIERAKAAGKRQAESHGGQG